MQQEAQTLERMETVETELVAPPLVDGDRVAIRWRFTFTPRGGTPFSIEEVAWQRWKDDRIVEETFFYDPAQFGKTSGAAA